MKSMPDFQGKSIFSRLWAFITRFLNARRILPQIRGTQPVLLKPQTYHEVREKMLNNDYDYTQPENKIGGYQLADRNIFYVGDGHHRMAAAMDLYWKTGNAEPAQKLISQGIWSLTTRPPVGGQVFPAFSFSGRIRNFLAFF
jgi:hypothetical protein